jgi:2-desacetyl-2-hydroxyethyl bacteriochlorophyllide A dehydrogenase
VRAAALTADHGFEVVEIDDPAPRPDELLLAVRACGICGSDLKTYTVMPAGTVLGHEFCGTVVAVGRDVAGWREGQFVSAMPLRSCGRCRWCAAGEVVHCERVDPLGVGSSAGAFAELVRVDPRLTVAVPPAVGELGALVEPLAVGLHAVAVADVRPGARLLVLGGGSVGAAVTVWARRLGAAEVVVSDPVPRRRDDAGDLGATGVHDPGEGPPPGGFDVVIECVGAPGMIQTAVEAAGVRGRVVVAGVCLKPDPIVPLTALMKELELRFAVYYRAGEFMAAASLLAADEVDLASLVTGRVGLDGLGDAFAGLLSGSAERKIVVTPGAGGHP